jgi:hypothetical protein
MEHVGHIVSTEVNEKGVIVAHAEFFDDAAVANVPEIKAWLEFIRSSSTMNGYDAWLRAQQETKKPLPPAFHHLLTEWRERRDTKTLHSTTFQYVVDYWNRFDVALADIGYTRAELDQAKKEGKTLDDIVDEILARGVDNTD